LPSRRWLVAAALAVLGAGPPAHPALVEVTGLPRYGALDRDQLAALGTETVGWTVHGTRREVTGVRLDKVLAHLGFTSGPMGRDVPVQQKRAGYRKVLVATASDGYRAVFSVAEVVDGMGPSKVLIVWAVNGQPLPPEEGPFRLAALTDAEPSRSLRQLQKIEVLDPTELR